MLFYLLELCPTEYRAIHSSQQRAKQLTRDNRNNTNNVVDNRDDAIRCDNDKVCVSSDIFRRRFPQHICLIELRYIT